MTRLRRLPWRRVLRTSLSALGLAGIFGLAGVVGGVVHLDSPLGRRVLASTAARSLSDLFEGRITVARVEDVGSGHLRLGGVEVHDPDGTRVLTAETLAINADVLSIARDALFGTGTLDIVISHARADGIDVEVVPDAQGAPTIARAFALRQTAPTEPSTGPARPSRPVRVWMPELELGRVWGRGRVGSLPLLEANLGLTRGWLLATSKGVILDVQRFGARVSGLGGGDVQGTMTLHVRVPGTIWATFDGSFGEVQTEAQVEVLGKYVSATVSAPRADPDQVRGVLPAWPLHESVSARAQLAGELPTLQLAATADLTRGHLDAAGTVDLARELDLRIDVKGRDVDARAVATSAPETDVDVDVALHGFVVSNRLTFDVNGTTRPTTIAGLALPAADFRGTYDATGFTAKGKLHEEGLPIGFGLDVHPSGAVDVTATVRKFAMQDAPRVAKVGRMSGDATLDAKAHIEDGKIDAAFDAGLVGFSAGPLRAREARLTGRARGELAAPRKIELDAALAGRAVTVGQFTLDTVRAQASGPVLRPHVDAKVALARGPTIGARGKVELDAGPTVRDVTVAVERAGTQLSAKVNKVDLGRGEVDLTGLRLRGAGGELDGSLKVRPSAREFTVRADGRGLDLRTFGAVLGDDLARRLFRTATPLGTLDFRVTAAVDARSQSADLYAKVSRTGYGIVRDVDATLQAKLQGRALSGELHASHGEFGTLSAPFNGLLDGFALDGASWSRMSGDVNGTWTDINIVKPLAGSPISWLSDYEAKLATTFVVQRRGHEGLPSFTVNARTVALEAQRADGVKIEQKAVVASARYDASEHHAGVTVSLLEACADGKQCGREPWLSTSAEADVDLAALASSPGGWLLGLFEVPIEARASMQERDLSQLGWLLPKPPAGVGARVGGYVGIAGKLSEPKLQASVTFTDLTLPAYVVGGVDGQLIAIFDPARGKLGVKGSASHDGRKIVTVDSEAEMSTAELFALASGAPPDWQGTATLGVNGVPLGDVVALRRSGFSGALAGNATLARSAGGLPQISSSFSISDATVAGTSVGDARFTLRGTTRQVKADLNVLQGTPRANTLHASLSAATTWQGFDPSFDRNQPVSGRIEATGFNAAALQPVVAGVLARVSGRIDGTLAVQAVPREASLDAAWRTSLAGDLQLRDGGLQIAVLGLELQGVHCSAVATTGKTESQLVFERCGARARSNADNVQAAARLYIDGTSIDRGAINLAGSRIPLLVEGVSNGDATGSVQMRLQRQHDPDEMHASVGIDDLEIRLPQSSGHDVIDLGANRDVVIAERQVKADSGPAAPWEIAITLGSRVRITRSNIVIPVSGRPTVHLGTETRLGGYIDLSPGGQLVISGKRFVIEHGRVFFDTARNDDPRLDVAATWRAPDHLVRAAVSGTYRDPKLRLSTDDGLELAQIYLLLQTGSLGSSGTQSADVQGLGVAGAGLGYLFEGTPGLDRVQISASSGRNTTGADSANYTASVRVSDDVWFEGTYTRAQTSSVSSVGGGTSQNAYSGTIDWRFRQDWSLRTEVGTQGAGLDVLWQHRY